MKTTFPGPMPSLQQCGATRHRPNGSVGTSRAVFVLVAALLTLLALLVSGQAMAQAAPGPGPGGFTVRPDDYFVNFLLRGMLGDVVNVNSATSATTVTGAGTLGGVFRAFNLGVAFFGSVIIMFLVLVGILQTGNDGEFLGRKWSSMWVPVRFAGGAALLLPVTNSGYSFVQAMCLWIAGQGVGFADTIWTEALRGLTTTRSGSEIVSTVSISSIAANVMSSKLCQKAMNQRIASAGPDAGYTSPVNLNQSAPTLTSANSYRQISAYGTVATGGNVDPLGNGAVTIDTNSICGTFVYNYRSDPSDPLNSVRLQISRAHAAQLQILDRLFDEPAAQYVATYSGQPSTLSNGAAVQPAGTLEAVSTAVGRAQFAGSTAYETALREATDAAIAASPMGNAIRMADTMDRYGFAVAGAFYLELSRTHNAVNAGLGAVPSYTPPNMREIMAPFGGENYQVMADAIEGTIAKAAETYARASGGTPNAAQTNAVVSVRTIDINEKMFSNVSAGWGLQDALSTITYAVVDSLVGVGGSNNSVNGNRLGAAFGGTGQNTTLWAADNTSVIMQMKAKGDTILNIASGVYMAYVAGMTTVGGIEGATSSIPGIGGIGGAAKALLEAVSAMVIATTMSLVVVGVLLSIMIPMTPFMMWAMGIAGLLVLILESLVASVLWAVMLMHPQGEGITSDRSREGLMILLTLFTRPALMLMGLLGGIYMVDPLVNFVNDLFFFAFKSMQSSSLSGLFTAIGIASIYTTLVIAIVKKTFALIHVIPDRVLRWIGGHDNLGQSMESDRADQLAGTVGSRVSNMQGGGGGGGGGAMAAARRKGLAASKKAGVRLGKMGGTPR